MPIFDDRVQFGYSPKPDAYTCHVHVYGREDSDEQDKTYAMIIQEIPGAGKSIRDHLAEIGNKVLAARSLGADRVQMFTHFPQGTASASSPWNRIEFDLDMPGCLASLIWKKRAVYKGLGESRPTTRAEVEAIIEESLFL